jgi:hypothetical protein
MNLFILYNKILIKIFKKNQKMSKKLRIINDYFEILDNF